MAYSNFMEYKKITRIRQVGESGDLKEKMKKENRKEPGGFFSVFRENCYSLCSR